MKKYKYDISIQSLFLKGDEGAEDVDHPCLGLHSVLDPLHCDGNLVKNGPDIYISIKKTPNFHKGASLTP